MPSRISEPLRYLEDLCSRPDTSAEDRSRRGYFALCLLMLMPPLAGYAVVDLARGRVVEASTTLVATAAMAGVVVLMSRLRQVWGIFRISCLLIIAIAFHTTATGGGDGLAFVWFYTTPLIVFFLFGGREGAIWVAGIFVVLFWLLSGDLGPHPHDPALSVRFLVTYGIVSLLAFGLEASRRHYYRMLVAEKTSLEEALADVKILSGLLPICAWCKAVRDDQGYWSQIETYVGRHSEAEVSHGMCPGCRERPESTPELKGEARASSPR